MSAMSHSKKSNFTFFHDFDIIKVVESKIRQEAASCQKTYTKTHYANDTPAKK